MGAHRTNSAELLVLLFLALVMGVVFEIWITALIIGYLIVAGILVKWHWMEWMQFLTGLVLAIAMLVISMHFLARDNGSSESNSYFQKGGLGQ